MIEVRPLGIEEYAERQSKPLSSLHEKLWLETFSKTRNPEMMVGQLEGGFLKMLALITGARRILEIGMFTGRKHCPGTAGSLLAISILKRPRLPSATSRKVPTPIKSK